MSMPPPGFSGPPPQGPPQGPPSGPPRGPQQGPPTGPPPAPPHQGPPQGPPSAPLQGPPSGPPPHPGPPPGGPVGFPPGPPPGLPLGGPVGSTGSGSRLVTAIWLLAGIGVAGVLLGLSLKENGNNAWHHVHAWGVLPIAGAALTAAPALSASSGLTPRRAWQLAVAGAALLVLFWILLVLPDVGSNTTLLTTVGTAAGVLAVWIAPTGLPGGGRPGPPDGVW